MPDAVVSVALFISVLILVIWQPRGVSVGWPAGVGGALAVLLGIVSLADVATVVGIVWDATLTFVSLILISLVLDAAGTFEWAALHMVRVARGSGRRLFVLSLLLGALVAALFANDGAALILTPIIYAQVTALRLTPRTVLAFLMAGGFIADATSMPLVVSNLVNIVSADFFHIGFTTYAGRMLPVGAVAVVASIGATYLLYRGDLPMRVPTEARRDPAAAIRDMRLFRIGWAVLALLAAGYVASQFLHVPVSAIAGSSAALLLVAANRSPAVDVRSVVLGAPWRIVVFSVGMYVVVFGLRDAGLMHLVAGSLRWAAARGPFVSVMYTGYLAALLSSVMNNMPAVMVTALSIQAVHVAGPSRMALALANVIGSDLGPKITPIGSLATLLWLHLLARKGIRISWGYYVRVGVILTIPVLAICLAALVAVMSF